MYILHVVGILRRFEPISYLKPPPIQLCRSILLARKEAQGVQALTHSLGPHKARDNFKDNDPNFAGSTILLFRRECLHSSPKVAETSSAISNSCVILAEKFPTHIPQIPPMSRCARPTADLCRTPCLDAETRQKCPGQKKRIMPKCISWLIVVTRAIAESQFD